mgnify:CR=1 FL=1
MIQKNNFSLKKIKKILLLKGYGIYKKQKRSTATSLVLRGCVKHLK